MVVGEQRYNSACVGDPLLKRGPAVLIHNPRDHRQTPALPLPDVISIEQKMALSTLHESIIHRMLASTCFVRLVPTLLSTSAIHASPTIDSPELHQTKYRSSRAGP